MDLTQYDQGTASKLYNYINRGSCVLLLGPLFGIKSDGNKIHTDLRTKLYQEIPTLDLDDDFDNLYISRVADGAINGSLIDEISKYYETTERNIIYDNIIKVGFKAIISFTSDLFLYQADGSNVYDFEHFSSKAKVKQENETVVVKENPIIYNVFGSLADMNSLVTDYDSLYDTLIGLLKANLEIPLQLRNILGSSMAFLFLGFDLTKWYIPLIVRKLNQFIVSGNRTRTSVSGYVSLSDTVIVNAASVNSLNKYPMTFTPFAADLPSGILIDHLLDLKTKVPKPVVTSKPTLKQPERDFFSRWQGQFSNYGFEDGLQLFFDEYKAINYRGPFNDKFSLQNMTYNDALQKRAGRPLNGDKFTETCSEITDQVQFSITEILKL